MPKKKVLDAVLLILTALLMVGKALKNADIPPEPDEWME